MLNVSKLLNKHSVIEEIYETATTFEVVLKDGFVNQNYGETIYTCSKDYLEDVTPKEFIEQADMWLCGVIELGRQYNHGRV